MPRGDECVKVVLGAEPGRLRLEYTSFALVSRPQEPVPAREGRGVRENKARNVAGR